jgi:hypothetical protein
LRGIWKKFGVSYRPFFLVCYLLGLIIYHPCVVTSTTFVWMKAYYWLLYKCYAYSYLQCKHAFAEYFGFYFVDCRFSRSGSIDLDS